MKGRAKTHELMSVPFSLTLALPLLLPLMAGMACFPKQDPYEERPRTQVTIEPSVVIPTVAWVRWTTDIPDVELSYLEYGLDEEYDRMATGTVDADGAYGATLLGLKADRDYYVRAVVVAGGLDTPSTHRVFHTGAVPAQLPALEVTELTPGVGPGGFLITSMAFSPSAAVILDEDGDYVWWHWAHDRDYSLTRALLTHDRQSVVYSQWINPEDSDEFMEVARLRRVAIDGSWEETLPVVGVHHDFTELEDGTLAVIAYDVREIDGVEVRGDHIVELAPDGTQTEIWSVWNELQYDPGSDDSDGPRTWTHANALDFDAGEGAYYLSIPTLDTIVKIDRASGQSLWMMGAVGDDFWLEDGGVEFFARQHQLQALPDGIVVFDNGRGDDLTSRVIEYGWDGGGGLTEPVWEYVQDPPLFCTALGDVHRFGDGSTLVVWSTAGLMEIVDPQGELAWQLGAELGGVFGFVTWLEDLSPPAGPPGD